MKDRIRPMDDEEMELDYEALRAELSSACMGAYFGGGFGVALIEEMDVRYATNSKLLSMARDKGYDLAKFRK